MQKPKKGSITLKEVYNVPNDHFPFLLINRRKRFSALQNPNK